ncbi:hypothetical protein [Roseovarius aestuariivivens]|uniref:hypothetical protein n=1 Tax=Roseovarius aestuariivivens TaxID=1888910 RepID=UPI001080F271|nr:hypothetical protein [Roseovarius aestuariivivens]
MQFRNITLAAILTGSTALGAYAADTIEDAGNNYEDAAEISGNYVYDTDTYEVGGQVYKNVGGEIRGENEAIADEDSDTQMSETEATSAENIIVAATPGTAVSSSNDVMIGTVAYTQEMSNGYRVFVEIDPATQIAANVIGFSVDSLEVKTVGEGIEYDNTVEHLRERVADKS